MREDFTKATKRIIAARAGNECSYLNCHNRTSGPDMSPNGSLQAGVAAHIYSASPKGPRGQGGLTRQELMHHQNGIWLCSKHASLIDANNGVGHPPEKLFSYKRLHEHRVQKEVLGVCSTIGWIDEFELIKSPMFASGTKVKLGKLNLLFGDNCVGKTAFSKYLGAFFDTDQLGYWHAPGKIDLDFKIQYYNPDPISIRFSVTKEHPVRYEVNGNISSKNPVNCHLITVPEFDVRTEGNDKAFIARILKIPEWEVVELVESINSFPHSNLRNYRFIDDKENGGNILHVDVRNVDYPERIFNSLSSTEQKRVFIDFATAAARQASKVAPTLLVLDCNMMGAAEHFEKFETQLLAPENHFQTIMTMRLDGIDLADVQWRGWEVIRLYRDKDSLTLFSQDPKMRIAPMSWKELFLKRQKKKRLSI